MKRSSETRPIALVGMTECHKAALARELSRRSGRSLFDFQQALEMAMGVPYHVLKEIYTPEQLCELEQDEAISAIGAGNKSVFALTGNIAANERAFRFILEHASVVWIEAESRVASPASWVSKRGDPSMEMRSLARQRWLAVYRAAHATVDVSECSASDAVSKLWRLLENISCGGQHEGSD